MKFGEPLALNEAIFEVEGPKITESSPILKKALPFRLAGVEDCILIAVF
jgi:hypothetical protein